MNLELWEGKRNSRPDIFIGGGGNCPPSLPGSTPLEIHILPIGPFLLLKVFSVLKTLSPLAPCFATHSAFWSPRSPSCTACRLHAWALIWTPHSYTPCLVLHTIQAAYGVGKSPPQTKTWKSPAQKWGRSYFLPRDALVHSAVLRLHVVRLSVCLSVRLSVCLSVTLVDQDHIGWKSWKLTARSIRLTPSFFVAQRPST